MYMNRTINSCPEKTFVVVKRGREHTVTYKPKPFQILPRPRKVAGFKTLDARALLDVWHLLTKPCLI